MLQKKTNSIIALTFFWSLMASLASAAFLLKSEPSKAENILAKSLPEQEAKFNLYSSKQDSLASQQQVSENYLLAQETDTTDIPNADNPPAGETGKLPWWTWVILPVGLGATYAFTRTKSPREEADLSNDLTMKPVMPRNRQTVLDREKNETLDSQLDVDTVISPPDSDNSSNLREKANELGAAAIGLGAAGKIEEKLTEENLTSEADSDIWQGDKELEKELGLDFDASADNLEDIDLSGLELNPENQDLWDETAQSISLETDLTQKNLPVDDLKDKIGEKIRELGADIPQKTENIVENTQNQAQNLTEDVTNSAANLVEESKDVGQELQANSKEALENTLEQAKKLADNS